MPRKFATLLYRFGVAPLPIPAGWHALPLRLVIGLGFVEHGRAKLSRGADGFIAILDAIGAPFADLLGWSTIIVEIGGGPSILAGAFVPIVTVPMIVVLLVATFTVHLPYGFSSIKLLSYDAMGAHFGQPGYETDLLYVAGLVALSVGGTGPFSVDGHLKDRMRRTCSQTGTPGKVSKPELLCSDKRRKPSWPPSTTARSTSTE